MRFFDCNCWFGLPSVPPLMPVPDAEGLLAAMDRAGIAQALTWHIAQHDAAFQVGNALLAEAIAPYPRLTGCWTIVPSQTGELPPADTLFAQMAVARIGALRIFPSAHRFLANAVSLGDLLQPMVERRIPLFLSVRRGLGWPEVHALLAEFPGLTCVICDHGCWGQDRLFRPLLAHYPRVYVDTAQYLLDGGIEALVRDFGPERLLFGTGYPELYHGGMMLALQHAQIGDEAKSSIAHSNLERILGEARL